MKATLQVSSLGALGGVDELVLATGTFITLEAEDEVPFDIRRLWLLLRVSFRERFDMLLASPLPPLVADRAGDDLAEGGVEASCGPSYKS